MNTSLKPATDLSATFGPEMPSHLLVVDDQPINIQVPELCANNPPDLILLDVVMPEMNGLEACRRLKADPLTANIPVIFVTGQTDPAEETRGFGTGAVDFITKPVNPAVVRARVKTHLTLKAPTDLLCSLVFIDGLTGVANRRRFDKALAAEWSHCRRSGIPLALLMIDIDFFKRYNDQHGRWPQSCLQKRLNPPC